MAGDQLLELGHQPVGGAGGQVGLDPVLERLQAQPVQAGDGRSGEGGRGRIGQGRAPPQRQRLAQQGPCPVGVAAQLLAAGQGQRLEADGVHGLGVHGQPVAARRGLEHPREQTPQPGDERLQGIGRPGRRVVVPDRVDQLGRGHDPPRVEGQAQQQPAEPRPRHLDRQARPGPHLQRAQDGDAQAAGHAPILPPAGSSGRSGAEPAAAASWDPPVRSSVNPPARRTVDFRLGPTLSGHLGGVRAAAFAPDGGRIVTGAFDGVLRLWDPATGVELGRVHPAAATRATPWPRRETRGSPPGWWSPPLGRSRSAPTGQARQPWRRRRAPVGPGQRCAGWLAR